MQLSSSNARAGAYTILMANCHENNVFSSLPKELVIDIAKRNIDPRVNIWEYIADITTSVNATDKDVGSHWKAVRDAAHNGEVRELTNQIMKRKWY